MKDSRITLRDFFSFTEKDVPRERTTAVEFHGEMAAIREKINRNLQEVSQANLYREVTEKLDDILDVDLTNVLVGGWKKGREILKYADGGKYPPEATYLVHLAEHTIASEHRPYIEILVDEQPVGRVEFKIKIALTLQGVILRIQGGHIRSI